MVQNDLQIGASVFSISSNWSAKTSVSKKTFLHHHFLTQVEGWDNSTADAGGSVQEGTADESKGEESHRKG